MSVSTRPIFWLHSDHDGFMSLWSWMLLDVGECDGALLMLTGAVIVVAAAFVASHRAVRPLLASVLSMRSRMRSWSLMALVAGRTCICSCCHC